MSLDIPNNSSDDDLAVRMANHDHAALDEIYDRHCAQAFGLCVYILGDNQRSETVLLESFRRVWNQSGTFNPAHTRFVTWLLSIVHHCAIAELRRLRGWGDSKVRGNVNFNETSTTQTMSALSMEPMLANLQTGQIKAALGQLTIHQCTIIMMTFFGGYTLYEIASHMDESLDTVHAYAQAGLLKLGNLLSTQKYE